MGVVSGSRFEIGCGIQTSLSSTCHELKSIIYMSRTPSSISKRALSLSSTCHELQSIIYMSQTPSSISKRALLIQYIHTCHELHHTCHELHHLYLKEPYSSNTCMLRLDQRVGGQWISSWEEIAVVSGRGWDECVGVEREVGGWGRDPKKCTGRDWGMGSSTI